MNETEENKKKDNTTRKIIPIPIEQLILDNENPRFAGSSPLPSQNDIAKNLWEEMHLDELILSIAVNGYYEHEPLLVVKKDENYLVIEGNRRLAAVKILLDSNLAKYVGARQSDLPKIGEEVKERLKKLPVIIYSDRKQLWNYLSFRHINGARSWTAVSKAEFVANLHLNSGISFNEILTSTGDRNKTSLRLFNGLMVLRQGEKNTRFNREDFNAQKFNFSHLYTIVQYPNTKKFLGIENLEFSKPFPENPIPTENEKELEEILIWLFGSKSGKIQSLIKSQNPDLKMLDDILGNNDALDSLRDTKDLKNAHEDTKQEDRRLETYVFRAEKNIRLAKSLEDSYKGGETLANKIKIIHSISGEMLEKIEKKQ